MSKKKATSQLGVNHTAHTRLSPLPLSRLHYKVDNGVTVPHSYTTRVLGVDPIFRVHSKQYLRYDLEQNG